MCKFGVLMKSNFNSFLKITLVSVLIVLYSCGGVKDRVFFDGLEEGMVLDSVYWKEARIRKGDQISINVASLNPAIDQVINTANAISGLGGESGYFVSEKGFIFLPRVGNLMVEGMTYAKLTDTLQTLFSEYTKSPIVSVRLVNFQIVVLGEVRSQGVLRFPTPNIDIYHAIGMAGGLTDFGKGSRVLLIRQTDSSRIVHRIDLSNPAIIGSSIYQLQSGDLLYVEPNSARKTQTSLTWQFFPIITGGLTLLTTLLLFVTRF